MIAQYSSGLQAVHSYILCRDLEIFQYGSWDQSVSCLVGTESSFFMNFLEHETDYIPWSTFKVNARILTFMPPIHLRYKITTLVSLGRESAS
jgi:hypothetical protein